MGVAVLMPVLNGARFLPEQLDSLARQTEPPEVLIVSDDGSNDDSCGVVRRFARRAPFEVRVGRGPGQGYAANVLSLLAMAPEGALAFCDQDDTWVPDRLARGMRAIGRLNAPALHVVARAALGRPKMRGDRRRRPPADPFATALIQNIAPANATLLNPAAACVARRAAARLPAPPPFPDWWIFGLIAGLGGRIVQDPAAGVYYRDHGGNLLGSVRSLAGVRRRIGYLCDGSFGQWLRQNTRALEDTAEELTPEARLRLASFSRALEEERPRDWLALSDRGICEKMLLKIIAAFGLI